MKYSDYYRDSISKATTNRITYGRMDRFDLMTNIENNGENAYQASMEIEFHGDLQIVGVDIDEVK